MATSKKPARGSSKPKMGKLDIEGVVAAIQAADGEAGWDEARSRVVGALRGATSVDDIQRLFAAMDRAGDEGLFYGEGSIWPEVGEVLVERAANGSSDAETATCMELVTRLCTFRPTDIARPDRFEDLVDPQKRPFVHAVDARLDDVRRLARASGPGALAAVFLLAHCPSATAQDARDLLARAASKQTASWTATLLLAAGIVTRRLAKDERESLAGEARAVAGRRLGEKGRLPQLCATALLALIGDTLKGAEVEILADHAVDSVPVPGEWGWGLRKAALRSDKLAVELLTWARCADPAPAIDRLVSMKLDKEMLGYAFSVADVLAKISKDRFGRLVSPTRSSRDDVDAPARRGLIAKDFPPRVRDAIGEKLGFGFGDLPKFLDGTGPEWRPIPVVVGGSEHRWHFHRIVDAVMRGEVTVERAVDTVLASYPLEDAVGLVDRYSATRAYMLRSGWEEAAWHREQNFAIAVIEGARDRGFDLAAHIHRAAIGYSPNPEVGPESKIALYSVLAHLGIVALRERPNQLSNDVIALAARAVSSTQCLEPLRTLVSDRSADDRRTIMRFVELSTALPAFWKLGLDDPKIIGELVVWGSQPMRRNGPETRKRILDCLVEGGAPVRALLETLEVREPYRQSAKGFINEVLAASRAG
jgi:hypothetical protein